MTKADIAERIQEGTGFTKKESIELMEAAFSIMKETIAIGETLKISGFGSFIVKKKGDRRGRNPQICTSSARNGQAKSAELKVSRKTVCPSFSA